MIDYDDSDDSSLIDSDPENAPVKGIEEELRRALVDEVKAKNRYRNSFFWWGIGITSLCVVLSAGGIVFLSCMGLYGTPVGVAFVSGLSVEVVGIAVVIAKYLFPSNGGTVQLVSGSKQDVIEKDDV